MFIRCLMVGVHHRLATFLFLVAATLVSGMGLAQLQIDTGFQSLIPASHPDRRLYEQVVREFGTDNRAIVYVADNDLWTREKLKALEDLHYALEALEFVRQVEDLFTTRSIRGSRDKVESGIILARAPKTRAGLDRAWDQARNHPLLIENLMAKDGRAVALVVSIYDDIDAGDPDRLINRELEEVLDRFRPVFTELFQVGKARINTDLRDVLFKDMRGLAPLSALVLVTAILVFLGSGFAALVPLVTSGLSILWTFGIMGWAGIPLNILSAMLPSLIAVIGSTEDTHMIACYFQGLGRDSKDASPVGQGPSHAGARYPATRLMMRHLGVPLILTVFTTAMGFASNLVSSLGLIREFALAATIAVLANGVITLTLVPMALSVMGPESKPGSAGNIFNRLPGLFTWLFGFTREKFPRAILAAMALVCGFFLFQCTKLYVTNDPLSYFRDDQPLVRDTRTIHRNLAGMKFFYITLAAEKGSGQDSAFLAPANIRKLAEIQNFMEKQGVFDASLSLADHLSLVNQAFNGGDPAQYRVPGQRTLVAQYLTFFHRRDLKNYVNHELDKACIVVRHHITDASKLNRYIRELEQVLPDIAGPGMRADVVGENLMISAAARDLLSAQAKSLILLLAVIFLITSIMFTSVKGGMIALVPSLIPVILMFGIMGFLGIPLNPGTAMVAVISIGIAIDNTLHLFSRYNELCRRTSDYGGAVMETVRQEATPMVTTSLALALGFGVLLFSDFTIIAQFGALSAATMIIALFTNLLITPVIMSKVRLVALYQILALKMHKDVLEKSPLFRGMTQYQMRKAILISELNEFDRGQMLVERGTMGRSMYLILSGRAEVIRKKGRDERCLARLGPGQIFGEIGFVREICRTADVRAVTPVEVLRFDYEKLEADLKFFPYIVAKLNFNISRVLGERLADTIEALDNEYELPAPSKDGPENITG
ncbi:MAG: efflux RND transporter permease subunit [Desulfobacterales bacterium]|nr:efflux RND transporter permease subunit [Desulfobacterales bacterium]